MWKKHPKALPNYNQEKKRRKKKPNSFEDLTCFKKKI